MSLMIKLWISFYCLINKQDNINSHLQFNSKHITVTWIMSLGGFDYFTEKVYKTAFTTVIDV